MRCATADRYTLGDGDKPERRRVMFGDMIARDTGLVGGFHITQPVFIEALEWLIGRVQMIEYAKFQECLPDRFATFPFKTVFSSRSFCKP